MLLLADGGSTKIQWVVLDGHDTVDEFTTPGLNPCLLADKEFRDRLAEALGRTKDIPLDRVVYYGAGCIPEVCPKMEAMLKLITGCSEAEVCSDMLGAARALCGDKPGIAAILGTGANSCWYDGREIAGNTPPLGYILGDEGSGARLGIALLNGVLKGYLPSDLAETFSRETAIDKAEAIRRVYREPAPNTFLASLTRFIAAHIAEPCLDAMVTREFELFFERNIIHAYPAGLPVHFAGSVAAVFEKQLRKAAAAKGITVGRIAARPLPLLISYHISSATIV